MEGKSHFSRKWAVNLWILLLSAAFLFTLQRFYQFGRGYRRINDWGEVIHCRYTELFWWRPFDFWWNCILFYKVKNWIQHVIRSQIQLSISYIFTDCRQIIYPFFNESATFSVFRRQSKEAEGLNTSSKRPFSPKPVHLRCFGFKRV